MNLSICLLKLKKPLEAIKHAKEATTVSPESSKAHYRLYQAYK